THEQFRPARTVGQQATVVNAVRNNTTVQQTINVNNLVMAKPLTEIVAKKEVRFEPVKNEARKQAVERVDGLRKTAEARAAVETKLAAQSQSRQKPEKVERPRSPIAAKPVTGTNAVAGRVPPAPPEHPQPNPAMRPETRPQQRLPKPDVHLEPKPRNP